MHKLLAHAQNYHCIAMGIVTSEDVSHQDIHVAYLDFAKINFKLNKAATFHRPQDVSTLL